MKVKAAFTALLLLFSAGTATPQGFAGLGDSAEGFSVPNPETRLSFPADHGPHREFRIEWWYLTANLNDDDGTEYGVQWTLFRNALSPGGRSEDQVWMAHAAITGPSGHYFAQRLSRGDLGTAGVMALPLEAFLDEWYMRGPDLNDITLSAQGTDFADDLKLVADGRFVPQGVDGYSAKSEAGLASHYYSQPHYQVEGRLVLPQGTVDVAGQGWLDREWSSQPLAPSQTGWDWISLHLDSGDKLMGYRLRDQDAGNYTVGTWISADGSLASLSPGELTMTPTKTTKVAGREIPTSWRVLLAAQSLEIDLQALYPNSWMPMLVPYWEGPVRVTGSHNGRGYLEMTGYE